MPVQAFPRMWEATTMITISKYKQGELWKERQGHGTALNCVCHNHKHKVTDGYLTPANNQFVTLNKASKYSILPAKGERIVVTYLDAQ